MDGWSMGKATHGGTNIDSHLICSEQEIKD
jgi:hypothetical protein